MPDADVTHRAQPHGLQGEDPGHGHDHEAPEEPLGRVDMAAWGTALLGGSIGLVVAVALAIATGG